jgi:hypothetical protein
MHSDCMILKLASEVERLRAELASAERECSVRAERELGYLARAQAAESALAAQPAPVTEPLGLPGGGHSATGAPGWIACAERMPASGQKVLAGYRNRNGMHRTIMAEWIAAKSKEGDEEHGDLDLIYDDAADCYYWPEGWYEVMDNWPEYSHLVVSEGDVTYWMPLPAPPAPERVE